MNQAITVGGLLHALLLIGAIASLFGTAWFWLNAFAAGMSDSPSSGPSTAWLYIAHGLPVALFVAWWLT